MGLFTSVVIKSCSVIKVFDNWESLVNLHVFWFTLRKSEFSYLEKNHGLIKRKKLNPLDESQSSGEVSSGSFECNMFQYESSTSKVRTVQYKGNLHVLYLFSVFHVQSVVRLFVDTVNEGSHQVTLTLSGVCINNHCVRKRNRLNYIEGWTLSFDIPVYSGEKT